MSNDCHVRFVKGLGGFCHLSIFAPLGVPPFSHRPRLRLSLYPSASPQAPLQVTKQTTKEFRRGAAAVAIRIHQGAQLSALGIANIDEEPTLCAARGPQLFNPWALVDPKDLATRRRH
eukprot:Skav221602  [mRNA]  locus=scaffold1698:564293:564646:- [translate_table: standard]